MKVEEVIGPGSRIRDWKEIVWWEAVGDRKNEYREVKEREKDR